MKKQEFNFLEKAYGQEVGAALNKNIPHLMQTKSKHAKKMAEDGLLTFVSIFMDNVKIQGYELTELGRLTYCAEC